MINLGYIFGILYLVLLLGISELLSHFVKLDNIKFITRKIVHIGICFEWFILHHFFGEDSIHWVILISSLTLLLLIIHPLFKSISDGENNFHGSLIYCIIASIFSFVSFIFPDLYYLCGMSLCALSLGDGFAGILGYLTKKVNITLYNDKTLIGSISAAIFTFIALLIFKLFLNVDISILEIIIISITFSFVELITPYELDNITTSSITLILLMLAQKTNILESYPFSFILIPLIGAYVLKKEALTYEGAICAFIISLIINFCLGDHGFLLLFSFFFITSIADLIKHNHKKELLKDMHDKVGKRDVYQVLACGLIPTILSILYYLTKENIFIVLYVTAIAENLADCLSSEIGVLSKNKPFDIVKLKEVEVGMSGGISLLGSISGLIGIILIVLIYSFTSLNVNNIIIISISALLGVIIDSVLGSTLQRKNICNKCNKITEKKTHCEEETSYHSGIKWIDNSMVNVMSNASSIIIAICLFFIFN